MTTLLPTALEAAAKAVLVEMDDRGLLKDVGDDLFDEIKNAVATAAITAYLAQAGKEGWVMVPKIILDAQATSTTPVLAEFIDARSSAERDNP